MFLSLLAIMSLAIPAAARDFTYNGIVYTVLDEEARTCSTKAGVFNPADSTVTPGNVVKGLITLPWFVQDEDSISFELKEIGDYSFAGCNDLIGMRPENYGSNIKIGRHAFENCALLSSVTIMSDNIEEYAFANCKSLGNILGSFISVQTIGKGVYENCTSLKSINLNSNAIGDWAFRNCKSLINVQNQSGRDLKIGRGAFENCASLTTVNANAVEINESAFANCSSLTGFDYSNVLKIGKSAFAGCASLSTAKFEVIETIGLQAFLDCKALVSLVFNQDCLIDSICDKAFYGCDNLTDIRICIKTPPMISDDVFSKYDGVRVAVPAESVEAYRTADNWAKFEIYGFSGSALKYTTFYDETLDRECARVVGYELNLSSPVIVPAEVEIEGIAYPIIEIGDSAFYQCDMFSEITLPASVAKIGDYAFAENGQNYIDIIQHGKITSLGKGAFSQCKLASDSIVANLLKSVVEIGDSAFSSASCAEAVTINIPETVTSIGEYTFFGFNDIERVNISNSVLSVGKFAFAQCRKLKKVKLSESLTELPDRLFNMCSVLDSVVIPESVTRIGNYTFGNCMRLATVNIPHSTVFIGREAFANCAMTKIDIPESVKTMGDGVFATCRQLESVTIPEQVTSMGAYTFMMCSSLKSVTLPKALTSIGERMFYQCSSLTSLTIPESVDSIGTIAFQGCRTLTELTLPESLKFVGKNAFTGANSMEKVYIPSMESWLGITFESETSNPTYYGAELIVAGKSAEVVEIPETANEVGDYAFAGQTTIKEVVIPDEVESIGTGSFTGCTGLEEVNIPETVKTVGDNAFQGCTSLVSAKIGKIVEAASRASGTSAVEMSVIGNSAFSGCESLDNVSVGANIGSVGESAFAGCGSIKRVDSYAMRAPEAALNSFEAAAQTAATLHVPQGYLDVYQASPVWSAFGTIVDDLAVAERVTISKATASIQEESTLTLIAESTSATQFEWTSSAPEVASVSETGVVTAHKVGTATITVTASSGARAFCDITVTAKPSGIEDVEGATALAVRAEGGEIVIDGNGSATVYSITGSRVATTTSGRVSGLPRGIYLVNVSGKTYKVAL